MREKCENGSNFLKKKKKISLICNFFSGLLTFLKREKIFSFYEQFLSENLFGVFKKDQEKPFKLTDFKLKNSVENKL